jgi:hypothetical protein
LRGEESGKKDPAPDTSRAALYQGADRPVRAASYAAYTGILYGDAADKMRNLSLVPQAGYDAAALYGSKCGLALLFGNGDCGSPLTKASGNAR